MKELCIMVMHLCYRVSTVFENFLIYKTYSISRSITKRKVYKFTFISMVYYKRSPLIKALA